MKISLFLTGCFTILLLAFALPSSFISSFVGANFFGDAMNTRSAKIFSSDGSIIPSWKIKSAWKNKSETEPAHASTRGMSILPFPFQSQDKDLNLHAAAAGVAITHCLAALPAVRYADIQEIHRLRDEAGLPAYRPTRKEMDSLLISSGSQLIVTGSVRKENDSILYSLEIRDGRKRSLKLLFKSAATPLKTPLKAPSNNESFTAPAAQLCKALRKTLEQQSNKESKKKMSFLAADFQAIMAHADTKAYNLFLRGYDAELRAEPHIARSFYLRSIKQNKSLFPPRYRLSQIPTEKNLRKARAHSMALLMEKPGRRLQKRRFLDDRLMGRAFLRLASLYLERKMLRHAGVCSNYAKKRLRKFNPNIIAPEEAEASLLAIRIQTMRSPRKNPVLSRREARKAVERIRQSGRSTGSAYIRNLMDVAGIYLLTGEHARSLEIYKIAIKINQAMNGASPSYKLLLNYNIELAHALSEQQSSPHVNKPSPAGNGFRSIAKELSRLGLHNTEVYLSVLNNIVALDAGSKKTIAKKCVLVPLHSINLALEMLGFPEGPLRSILRNNIRRVRRYKSVSIIANRKLRFAQTLFSENLPYRNYIGLSRRETLYLSSSAGQFSYIRHTPGVRARTYAGRHADTRVFLHDFLRKNDGKKTLVMNRLRQEILGKRKAKQGSGFIFIDIGPAVANSYNPAATARAMASDFKKMQVAALDLPNEVQLFFRNVPQKYKNRLTSLPNLHILAGDGTAPLKQLFLKESAWALKDRQPPQLLANVPVIIRAANSIDIYLPFTRIRTSLRHMGRDLRKNAVLYFYHRSILYKPRGSSTFGLIGYVSIRGFHHNKTLFSRGGMDPYTLPEHKMNLASNALLDE